jgi:hypothetical protein
MMSLAAAFVDRLAEAFGPGLADDTRGDLVRLLRQV